MSTKELATALSVTDALLSTATMNEVVEALRITCLMIAQHEENHSEVPMDRIFEVFQTEEFDEETERLLLKSFQNLVGVLGTVMEIESEETPVH